ncbi:cytochrome B [Sphingomonas lenta]|uniref:Cytochrome B n=2 Tax=Sphingomonas lenta TaxID=1141887 RepID=A0A2A2SI89_9SPHN|nr:cytochrome B [Sphingomonas lenta]
MARGDMATARYGRVAMVFHWTIAALIGVNLAIGLGHDTLFDGWVWLHKSIGLTVLALSLARLAWRLCHRPPPLPSEVPEWQRRLAHGVHWGLYGLMVALPLTGWVFTSASATPRPTTFGLFAVPPLPVGADAAVNADVRSAHALLAYCMLALIALHVAGALKHQLLDRVLILDRMLPTVREARRSI